MFAVLSNVACLLHTCSSSMSSCEQCVCQASLGAWRELVFGKSILIESSFICFVFIFFVFVFCCSCWKWDRMVPWFNVENETVSNTAFRKWNWFQTLYLLHWNVFLLWSRVCLYALDVQWNGLNHRLPVTCTRSSLLWHFITLISKLLHLLMLLCVDGKH